MQNYEELISQKIGILVKNARVKQRLSQQELASGICSQALISSIEHGEYIPNAAIFIALCNKLHLSIDDAFLKERLNFGNNDQLAQAAFDLCRQHQYQQLLQYLDQQTIIRSLNSDLDFQIYYYYYGCAVYQVECNLSDCQHYFKLAISYTMDITQPVPRNTVELLLVNALGFIYAQQKRTEEAFVLFKTVNTTLLKTTAQSENLNVIHFQQGKSYFELKQYDRALDTLLTGLKRINQFNSTFMLNNYALLILECYQHLQ